MRRGHLSRSHPPPAVLVCAAAAIFTLTGCSSSPAERQESPATGAWQSQFEVATSEWSSRGTNPYFVLEPGHRLVLEAQEDDEQLVITVLDETVMVDGVETRVVEERETKKGALKEISRNFFAISKRTNDVYYFGEDVDIYKAGKVVKHEGAWRSGVAGAKYGLMMPGNPRVGQKFQEETAPNVAMDRGEIASLDETFETPAGRFEHCLKVLESTPLEKGTEFKLYARGVGLLKDEDLLLVSYGKQPAAR